jgi:C-8 sterol isomerase
MDVYDCMFEGEMWTYLEGQLEETVYLPGDCAVLKRGEAKGYSMKENTWMLEYTRGFIPASLPIGAFAPLGLTADWHNFWDILSNYAGLVIHSFFD